MKGKRLLHHESLEARRLLAAECVPLPAEDVAALQLASPAAIQGESVNDVSTSIRAPGDIGGLPFYDRFALGFGPDLVQEHGDQLFVVNQHPFSPQDLQQLYVFERTNDGALEVAHEIDVDFRVEHMIVRDNQVVLVGSSYLWLPAVRADGDFIGIDPPPGSEPLATTTVMTVNLDGEAEIVRQEFDGIVHRLHHDGNRVVMLRSQPGKDVVIAIFPPPEIHGLLQTFEITGDGLQETASLEIPLFGMTEVSGDTLIMARSVHNEIVYLDDSATDDPNTNAAGIRAPDGRPLPHFESHVVVTQYRLGERIEEVGEVNATTGFVHNLKLTEEGQTAIVVSSDFSRQDFTSTVSILDLSGDQIQLFENVPARGYAIDIYDDYVLLNDYNGHLSIVNTNKAIDLAAESRVQTIETPPELHIHHQAIRLSGDRVVVTGTRAIEIDDSPPPPLNADGTPVDANGLTIDPWWPQRKVETVLLTISLTEARIVEDTHLGEQALSFGDHRFHMIDPDTDRFGFVLHEFSAAEAGGPRFVFGTLNENGAFEREGTIRAGFWYEIDVNSERLIARQFDRLIEYRWDNVDDPTVTPLGNVPPIEAVDDHYRLNNDGTDHILDVLSNDVIHHPFQQPAEIVALVDAPEGSEIVGGRAVRIPAEALEGKESLQFGYVISDGNTESTAVVEIKINSITEEQVRELIDRVKRRAAEDFGVEVEEVEIVSVERLFDKPLPVVLPDSPDVTLDLSPGILVVLNVPNATAMYAASLDGQIIQVFSTVRETLVSLGLNAVDDSGNTVVEVAEGQDFWLEFIADDLRAFGRGVYAAFFDLLVPTEHIVLTGEVEYGDGFISINQGTISEGEVDELGAIGDSVESPGGRPQVVLRMRAKAVGAGMVDLKPNPADEIGSETLLRGKDSEVPPDQVRYDTLTLTIVEETASNPLDTDGNGEVTAADALRVINFLHLYGTTLLADLADRVASVRGEGESDMPSDEMASMRRLDANRNGEITALDALVVINHFTVNDLIAETDDDDQTVVSDVAVIDQPSGLF